MVRCINLYIVPQHLKHKDYIEEHGASSMKSLCANWEYDLGDSSLKMIDICVKNMGSYTSSYCETVRNTSKESWCPKCHMFYHGLCPLSPVVKYAFTLNLGYSSPVGKQGVHKITVQTLLRKFPGTTDSDFVRLFPNNMMYREISRENVSDMFSEIDSADPAIVDCEISGLLNFFKEYIHFIEQGQPVRIIIQNNY